MVRVVLLEVTNDEDILMKGKATVSLTLHQQTEGSKSSSFERRPQHQGWWPNLQMAQACGKNHNDSAHCRGLID